MIHNIQYSPHYKGYISQMQLLTDVQIVDKKAVDCTRDFLPGLMLLQTAQKILFHSSLIFF